MRLPPFSDLKYFQETYSVQCALRVADGLFFERQCLGMQLLKSNFACSYRRAESNVDTGGEKEETRGQWWENTCHKTYDGSKKSSAENKQIAELTTVVGPSFAKAIGWIGSPLASLEAAQAPLLVLWELCTSNKTMAKMCTLLLHETAPQKIWLFTFDVVL